MKRLHVSFFLVLCLLAILVISGFAFSLGATSTAKKVYSTDFESVTKKNDFVLDMGIDNLFVFDNSTACMFMDDGSKRPNSPVPHSGNRAVCLEITKGHRNEFNLMNMQNLVQKELYISVWLYLPANFQMHMPNGNWFEIANPLITAETFAPYFALHISQESTQPEFSLQLYQRDINRDPKVLKNIPNIDLPRGRWFNLQYYVYHDDTDGVIKVWFDDPMMQNQPIIEVSGVDMAKSSEAWYTTIAKIYHDPKDTYSPYQLWVDDLEIWNGMPPQRLNVNLWTDKGDNSQLPVSWGCLGSYKEGETLVLYYSTTKDSQGKLIVTDSSGSSKTLVNSPISQGTANLNLLLKGPTGYWSIDFSASTEEESNADNFHFCVVKDYVKFRGILLSVSDSAANGDFYQVKVTNVISDPTGEIHVDDQIQVHWNYSLAKADKSLDSGSYVEVYGGYVPSTVGDFSKAVVLANSDNYLVWVMTHSITVDPNKGQLFIDDASEPIVAQTTYNWPDGSEHKLYAIPAFESPEGKFTFSKWSDGSIENPRTIKVNGSGSYTAYWVPAKTPASITVISPSNTTFTTDEVALTLNTNTPVKWLAYSLDETTNVSITGNMTLSGLTNGSHSLIIYAEDYFGNIINSARINFDISIETSSVDWRITIIAVIAAVVLVVAIILSLKKFYTKSQAL